MIKITPEKINYSTCNKTDKIYLIIGNNSYLKRESLKKICKIMKTYKFEEKHNFNIQPKTNWNKIYQQSKSISLFSKRKIFILTIIENEISKKLEKKIIHLIKIINKNILLIFNIKKITNNNKNNILYKTIKQKTIYINCNNKKNNFIHELITKKTLIPKTNNCIKNYYNYIQKNLTKTNYTLKKISTINKKIFTINYIKKFLNNSNNFKICHLIESILSKDHIKSIYILNKLKKENIEILIILHIIKNIVFITLLLKKKHNIQNIKNIFEKYKLYKNKSQIITFEKQTNICIIEKAIQFISKIEIQIKTKNKDEIWNKLKTLFIILCYKKN